MSLYIIAVHLYLCILNHAYINMVHDKYYSLKFKVKFSNAQRRKLEKCLRDSNCILHNNSFSGIFLVHLYFISYIHMPSRFFLFENKSKKTFKCYSYYKLWMLTIYMLSSMCITSKNSLTLHFLCIGYLTSYSQINGAIWKWL